jgi:hypothetical protein
MHVVVAVALLDAGLLLDAVGVFVQHVQQARHQFVAVVLASTPKECSVFVHCPLEVQGPAAVHPRSDL